MPGQSTSDAIFIIRQLQEKHFAANKPMFIAFEPRCCGVGCACHPRHVTNVRSQVRVNGQYSEEFGVGVGVHQGSVLSPLLFILVLEALSCEFRTGVPWKLLYADDLAVIANTLEECVSKLKAWKEVMENKGLRVNMKKTDFMVTGPVLDVLRDWCISIHVLSVGTVLDRQTQSCARSANSV